MAPALVGATAGDDAAGASCRSNAEATAALQLMHQKWRRQRGLASFLMDMDDIKDDMVIDKRSDLFPFHSDKKRSMGRDVITQRIQHNYFLDRGMKFMISHRDPYIAWTDLFDLKKFGCYPTRGRKKDFIDPFHGMQERMDFGKEWWLHPSMVFNIGLRRIGVRLQDLTSGEVRWDAVYNIEPAKKEDGPLGKVLFGSERPIGGEHPYFQPDWCPAPHDFTSHRYRLTVTNLSADPSWRGGHPGMDTVGEMFFTQYFGPQLENTYAHENLAPLLK